jgi:hypothetical protein
MIAASISSGVSDTRPETREFGSQGDLVRYLQGLDPAASKTVAPLIKLARYDGSGVREANLLAISGIEGDHDRGDVTPERAVEMLEAANLRAIVVTTAQHGQPGKGSRWRVFAILSEERQVSHRTRLVARLNGVLGGALAGETFTTAQRFFIGPVRGNEDNYVVHVTFGGVPDRGRFIDKADDLDAGAVGKSGTATAITKTAPTPPQRASSAAPAAVVPATTDGKKRASARATTIDDSAVAKVMEVGRLLVAGDGRRELLKSYIARRSAKGLAESEIEALILAYRDEYFDPAEPFDEANVSAMVQWATQRDARSAAEGTATIDAAIEAHAAGDAGALFAPEVIEALRAQRDADAAAYQRTRAKVKGLRPAVLMRAFDEAVAEPRAGRNDDSTATQLVALARGRCTLIHDAQGEGYAVLPTDDHFEVWRLDSSGFRDWLSHSHYVEHGIAPADQALSTAVATLRGAAKFEGEEAAIHLRRARVGDALYLDLVDDRWRVIEVDCKGWRILERSPVRFVRSKSMAPLPEPVLGGRVDRLWDFINARPDDHPLILAWMIECMREGVPDIVLELIGEQGSAKSSAQRMLRALVDPNAVPLRAVPKSVEDLFVTAATSGMLSLDNLSGLSASMQDALCGLATGTGYAGRKLFTDADESAVQVQRPIVINAIVPVATRPDLIDRSIHVSLPQIEARRTASEVEQDFAAAVGQILGGILDLAVASMRELPKVSIAPAALPRVADFAILGEAMMRAQGAAPGTFLALLNSRRRDGVMRSVDASPVSAAVLEFLDEHPDGFIDHGDGRATVKALFVALRGYQQSGEGWPRSPKAFADELRRCAPALRQVGIEVRVGPGRSRYGYLVSVRRTGEAEACVAPAPPAAQNDEEPVLEIEGLL